MDKPISELVEALSVLDEDLYVLEQGGEAKKLKWSTFIKFAAARLDGHGGIQSIALTGTSGLVDTYTITMADEKTYDIVVKNGRGISGIAKTGTSGLVDTYTISYNDGTSKNFTVTNGAKGDKGDNTYTWIKYASQEPTDSSHSMGDIPDEWRGEYNGPLSSPPTDWKAYKWYKVKGDKGDKGDAATLVSKSVTYQVGDSGSIIPSGMWVNSVPVTPQGKYLWAKTEIKFSSGDPIVAYSVARMGMDGSGSVSSVNNVSPDDTGNVALTADNVGALAASGGDMTGPINMNGQPISGLNDPTEESQAARKGYVDAAVRKAAPLNLLDNSDFRNPVNQRGQTSIVVNNDVYTYFIDRWCFVDWSGNDAGTLTLTDGGISVTVEMLNFYQRFEKGVMDLTKSYTLAVCYDDGTIEINKNPLFSESAFDSISFTVMPGKTVSWAALYEGSYTAETMPEYRPKEYAAELAACQRYFYRAFVDAYNRIGFCATNPGSECIIGVTLPVEMRAVPGIHTPSSNFVIEPGGTSVTSIGSFGKQSGLEAQLFVKTESDVSGALRLVNMSNSPTYIDFIADI